MKFVQIKKISSNKAARTIAAKRYAQLATKNVLI
jgi:hypothetical protein